MWQASSWGSLDYGGRWRALHHGLQALYAPTVVSLWVEENQTAHVHASHHGVVPVGEQTPTLLIEVNVTAVADGTVSQSHRLEWAPTATSVVGEVLSLPLGGVDTLKNVISTRLLGTEASETTHIPN